MKGNNIQTTKKNNNDKNTNKNNNNREEQRGGRVWKYLILGFIVQILGTRLIKYFKNKNSAQNLPSVNNIFTNETKFDINFYLSDYDDYRLLKNKKPIYSILDRKYCYFGEDIVNETICNIQLNITYNITKLLKLKNLKNAGIYLFSELKLKNESEYNNQIQKLKVDPREYYKSQNILKYISDLKKLLLNSQIDENMSPIETEATKSEKSTNTLSGLYYKPTFTFYFVKQNQKENIINFQKLYMMKFPVHVNLNQMNYFPLNVLTDFWTLNSELLPINKTETFNFTINLNYGYIRSYFFNQMLNIQINNKVMSSYGIDGVQDMLVELLKNNSIPYLILLMTVNILHTIFSGFGFKEDISYYNNLEKLDGVYTKYIFLNIFSVFISFLYNIVQGANFLVIFEVFVGFIIEIWKLKMIYNISFNKFFPFIHFDYKIKYEIKEAESYQDFAVSMMIKFLLIPIGIIYLIYRLYYYKSSSIFMFIIEYIFFLLNIFGFILLTPQIYLNYKLQSVEHLPLKAFIFKFLNTIIDDLFAFAVKTPTLYRIFCFKDDVIFVIYLYQMWIYRHNKRSEMNKIDDEKKKKSKEKFKSVKKKKKKLKLKFIQSQKNLIY